MNAAIAYSRMPPWTRLRHHCFRVFLALLFIQFLVLCCISLVRRPWLPASLGRRDITNRNHEDAAPVIHVNRTEKQQKHHHFVQSIDPALFIAKETAVETVLSDVDTFPVRKERSTEDVISKRGSVPGVDDVFLRLKEYLMTMNEKHFYTDLSAVKTFQKRTKAEDMNAQPMDDFRDMDSLAVRIKFLNSLIETAESDVKVRISVYTTSSVGLHGVRSELLPWMQYHTHLGVTHFYILYDGSDEAAVDALMRIEHVTLIHIHTPFATDEEVLLFGAWSDRHMQWGGKPGNYELMVKQGFGTTVALELAKQRKEDWLLHIDPDELFYPDNAAFSMVDVFLKQPIHVSSLRFMNFEGQPEFGDVINRYEQVTLFRTHKYFITPEANYLRNRCKLGDNRTFLVLYANGKSAVRVNAPGARQLGPHFFTGDSSERWKTEDNPEGEWRDAISNSSFILHYGYSYLSDVTSKAKRSCSGDEFKLAAKTMDKQELGKCFLIDFDRDAYVAAITGEEEDFFYSRQVLSEGVRLKCASQESSGWCVVHDVEYFKFLLTKAGLFRRAREPQQILRMHEHLIKSMTLKKNNDEQIDEIEEIHPLEHGWVQR